jgi:hypothetical protein
MTKKPTTIGSSAIGYTMSNGENIVLSGGDDVNIGGRVVCQRLPDGTYITHGKPKFNIGDSAIGVKTQNGEFIALAPGDLEVPDVPSWNCWLPDPSLNITPCLVNNTELIQHYHNSWVLSLPWSGNITPIQDALCRQIVQTHDGNDSGITALLNEAIGLDPNGFFTPWFKDDIYHYSSSVVLPNTCSVFATWSNPNALHNSGWYDPWQSPQYSSFPLLCSWAGYTSPNREINVAIFNPSSIQNDTPFQSTLVLDYFSLVPVDPSSYAIQIVLPLEVIGSYPDLYTLIP